MKLTLRLYVSGALTITDEGEYDVESNDLLFDDKKNNSDEVLLGENENG